MRASAGVESVAPGVYRLRTLMANLYLVGAPDRWVLVDAGVAGFASQIRAAACACFGDRPPAAIVLTHGHFDHRGSLPGLLAQWASPVYAHVLEFPYLTGRRAYSPPDPSVGGGLMARLSFLYPRRPIDLGTRLLTLPVDGSVPGVDGWQWIHTPGHTSGHVSLFRAADRVLLAGDAVVTTRQESAAAVMTQRAEVRPPPAYFTVDWSRAETSVGALAALEPLVLATGHGPTLRGPDMQRDLATLASHFGEFAPSRGWYVAHPAYPEREIAQLEDYGPLERRNRRRRAALLAAAALLPAAVYARRRQHTRTARARINRLASQQRT